MADSRVKIYDALDKIEGTGDVKALVKSVLENSDKESKKYRESSEEFEKKLDKITTEFGDIKNKLEVANSDGVEKTELEKLVAELTNTVKTITSERDTEKQEKEELKIEADKTAGEKRQGKLEKHFLDLTTETFGATGASDAVAVSRSKLSYSEGGDMMYDGKTGDEGAELFKTDNKRFLLNKGTSTNGGRQSHTTEVTTENKSSFDGFKSVASSMG